MPAASNPVQDMLNRGGTRIVTNPNDVRSEVQNLIDRGGTRVTPVPSQPQSNAPSSQPQSTRGHGHSHGGTNNPLNLPVQSNPLINAMNNPRSTIQQAPRPSFEINDSAPASRLQSGVLIVSQGESDAFTKSKTPQTVPSYTLSSTNTQDAIIEGSFIGITSAPASISSISPVIERGQLEVTTSNLAKTKDMFKEIKAFQDNPKSFVEAGKATGISTPTGESYQLSDKVFDKYFTKEANAYYAQIGRDYFESLSPSARGPAAAFQMGSAIGKAGLFLADVNIGKSILSNVGVQKIDFSKQSESMNIFGMDTGIFVAERNLGTFESIRNIPAVPSVYQTSDIPIITKLTGIERPTKLKDIPGYAFELPKRPEQLLNIGVVGSMGFSLVKGTIAAKELYQAERAAGATKLGALDIVGGEALYSLSPIRYYGFGAERIFITGETRLKPFSTTQINKGDTLTFVKVGEAGDAQLFTGFGKEIIYSPRTANYIVVQPRLSGVSVTPNKLTYGQGSIVSLRENLFSFTATADADVFKVSGSGQRNVFQFGTRPVQTGRYSLGTQAYSIRSIQEFNTFGNVKVFDNMFDLSFSKSTFKTVESYKYFSGYTAFGKDIPFSMSRSGKAFGAGISGRPSSAKGIDIFKEIGRVESDYGTEIFGFSFGKTMMSGRKQVNFFKVNTKIPKQTGINIQPTGTKSTQLALPKGIEVKNVYTKGEFDYLGLKQEQKLGIRNVAKTSLSSPKSSSDVGIKGLNIKQTLSPAYKVATIQSSSLILSESAININSQNYSNLLVARPTTLFAFNSKTSLSSSQLQSEITSPITTTPEILVPKIKTTPEAFTFGGSYDFGGFSFPPTGPGLIMPDFAFPSFSPGPRRTGKQRKKRTPSLYAALEGITSSKASALEVTGLTLRPILTGKRRSRK